MMEAKEMFTQFGLIENKGYLYSFEVDTESLVANFTITPPRRMTIEGIRVLDCIFKNKDGELLNLYLGADELSGIRQFKRVLECRQDKFRFYGDEADFAKLRDYLLNVNPERPWDPCVLDYSRKTVQYLRAELVEGRVCGIEWKKYFCKIKVRDRFDKAKYHIHLLSVAAAVEVMSDLFIKPANSFIIGVSDITSPLYDFTPDE